MSRLIKVNLLKITWLVSICEYAEKIPSMSNSSSMEISFQTVPRIHKNLKTLFLFLLSLFLFACIHCFVFFWGCYGVKEYGEPENEQNQGARCETPKESTKKLNKKNINSTLYITTQLLQKHTLKKIAYLLTSLTTISIYFVKVKY